ncbi:unnamed protein product, partial [Effrenium voratum]
ALESHSLLDLFRERVDYTVEASLQSCSLRELAESVTFALDAQGKEATAHWTRTRKQFVFLGAGGEK